MALLEVGQSVRDTYTVESFLGDGFFSEVYLVRHRFLGRQAMKVFKATGMDVAEISALLGEALILSRLGHPNIVRVFDANVLETPQGKRGFFTMEHVTGGNLETYWSSHAGPIPALTAVELLCQVCRGAAVGHAMTPPIIHRDIKPQNVLLGYDMGGLRVRLGDFGLARQVNPLTLRATAGGTLVFKAPETWKDEKSDSAAGDVWSIGMMLYLLLTNELPYVRLGKDETPGQACRHTALVPAGHYNDRIDEPLDEIIAKSLAVAPQDRYADAGRLLKELERWLAPRRPPVEEPPQPPAEVVQEASASVAQPAAPLTEDEAREFAARALKFGTSEGKLAEAVELMESAFSVCPALRDRYGYHVSLWRRGMTM